MSERKVRGEQINEIDKGVLDYPFSSISPGFLEEGFENIPGQKQFKISDFGDFPKNIKKYIWIFEGANDAESWRCLCILDNDLYMYYRAWCDCTGFDCRGTMEFYISDDLFVLINFAMTEEDYRLYEKETEPVFEAEAVKYK